MISFFRAAGKVLVSESAVKTPEVKQVELLQLVSLQLVKDRFSSKASAKASEYNIVSGLDMFKTLRFAQLSLCSLVLHTKSLTSLFFRQDSGSPQMKQQKKPVSTHAGVFKITILICGRANSSTNESSVSSVPSVRDASKECVGYRHLISRVSLQLF